MKVAICGASERFARLLRHLLIHDCRVEVTDDPDRADVCLLDWDGLEAARTLERLRRGRPRRPVLLLALQPPGQAGLPWLCKPLQPDQVREALQRLQARGTAPPSPQEKSVAGVSVPSRGVPYPFRHYDPERHLQGVLVRACRQALTTGIVLRLETGWEPILILPRQRAVWVGADDRKLQAFCRLSLDRFNRLAGELGQKIAIVPEPALQPEALPSGAERMDAFIWKVAWWNAAGRLPVSIPPDRPLRLKRWPNLTRYRHPPAAVRIAAAWYRQDLSPNRLALALGEGEAVAGFVSAAAALGLVAQAPVAASGRRPEPPPPPENLLKRILKRLQRAA